jgi:hypothetical protein
MIRACECVDGKGNHSGCHKKTRSVMNIISPLYSASGSFLKAVGAPFVGVHSICILEEHRKRIGRALIGPGLTSLYALNLCSIHEGNLCTPEV